MTGGVVDPSVGYGIYVFDILASFGPKDLLDIQMSSPVPSGSILATYTQRPKNNPGYQPLENPWTEAGIQQVTVPEPASLLLMGGGLAGLGSVRRRHRG